MGSTSDFDPYAEPSQSCRFPFGVKGSCGFGRLLDELKGTIFRVVNRYPCVEGDVWWDSRVSSS